MSRTVTLPIPGFSAAGLFSRPAQVVYRDVVFDVDSEHTIDGLIAAIAEKVRPMIADGVARGDIRISLDYDREEDYDGPVITPKLLVVGRRPATEADIEADRVERQRAAEQYKAAEIARLSAQIAHLERLQ